MSLLYEVSELKRVTSFKYLGVHIDHHLSFNGHVLQVNKKKSAKLGVLRRTKNFSTISAAERIHKTMILPTLDYCNIVWQGCRKGNCDSPERLQRRTAKLIHPNSALETDTLHYITLITLHYITLHYITLRYVTLRYVALRCVALHCVELRCFNQLEVELEVIISYYLIVESVSFVLLR